MKKLPSSFTLRRITESRLFFPFIVLAVILLFDLIVVPEFFQLEIKQGHLYGSLVDILRNGSCVMLLGIGMTALAISGLEKLN